jgi:hypothetical protein
VNIRARRQLSGPECVPGLYRRPRRQREQLSQLLTSAIMSDGDQTQRDSAADHGTFTIHY